MKVLLAEDEAIPRLLLEAILAEWGYEVQAVADGAAAWAALQADPQLRLALLDWMMPALDGIDICRRLRALTTPTPVYAILLTSRDAKTDVVSGLEAGANDYITKPFDRAELRARLQVGRTVLELQQSLAERVRELEESLAQVKQLRGLLPMCAWCKKIRDDSTYWRGVEEYFMQHTQVTFTHSICPDCSRQMLEHLPQDG